MTSLPTAAPRLLAVSCLASALAAGAAAAGDDPIETTKSRVAQDVQKVLDTYLIGPKGAADLGCSIAWQADAIVPAGQRLRLVSASPEGVLALNSRNELAFIRTSTGDRAWLASAAQSIDRVLDVDFVSEQLDRAYHDQITVLTDTQYFLLDPENGASVGRERLRHMPTAAPVAYEGRVIYGSRGGQAVWLTAATGFVLKASTLDPASSNATPILMAPAFGEGAVVFGSSKGTVGCFDARSGGPYWRHELLGAVTATPAIADGKVFVASEDQYLYAFDLGDGSTLWKYFTQSPLRTAPFAGNGLVLQDVPGEGCVALAMDAAGKLGGDVRWRKQGLAGAPIAAIAEGKAGAFLFWCPVSRVATVVDARNGDVIRSVALPNVEHLVAGEIEDGGFLAWNADGRIERLAPLPRAATPAADAAPAAPAAKDAANGPAEG